MIAATSERLLRKPDSPGERTPTGAGFPSGLAPDIEAGFAMRFKAAALLYGAVYLALFIAYNAWGRAARLGDFTTPWGRITLGIVGISLAVAALARSGWLRPEALLTVALLFEVFGAAGVEMGILFMPLDSFQSLGLTWTGVWVVAFAMVVPAPPGRALLAALATASVLPLFLLIRAAGGAEVGIRHPLVFASIANYISAGLGFAGSRIVYRLSRDVSRARRMGSYVLTEHLGSGGMGEVWRAEHRLLARPAAVKLVRLSSGDDGREAQRRFEREARATAALTSPHAVALYDYGVAEGGGFYYVMELLHGLDLHDLVDRFGPQSPSRVVHILTQACDALAEAHTAGLVHRDIKPANLYLCRRGMAHDFVKVLDFGLVKHADGDQTAITQAGTAAGTPAYMAPEMALGEPVDGRSDLYQLGCVAYWLLTGRPVFERDQPMQTALAHVQAPPVPPSRVGASQIPVSLENLVMRCLEKPPDRRPASAVALREALALLPIPPWDAGTAAAWWRTNLPDLTR